MGPVHLHHVGTLFQKGQGSTDGKRLGRRCIGGGFSRSHSPSQRDPAQITQEQQITRRAITNLTWNVQAEFMVQRFGLEVVAVVAAFVVSVILGFDFVFIIREAKATVHHRVGKVCLRGASGHFEIKVQRGFLRKKLKTASWVSPDCP